MVFHFQWGLFSNENTQFNNSAFAKRGSSFNFLDFGYRIGKTLGVTTFLFNNSNSVDQTAVLDKLNPPPAGIEYKSLSSNDFLLRGAMLGLLISKYGNLYDLDLKFMTGMANFTIPSMTIKYSQDGVTEDQIAKYLPVSKNTIGIGFGTSLRIHLSDKIDLTINGNYLIFQNSFNRSISDYNGQRTADFRITHESFNLNIGLAYRFLNDKSILNEN